MSSSIYLILQTDVHVDQNTGTFDLNFGEKDNNGKADIFLSKNEEVLISMLDINIDTSSQDASYIINMPGNPLDVCLSSFLTAELNYNQQLYKIQALENELDQIAKIIKEDQISHIINLHVNYKENRYGLHAIERTEIYALEQEKIPDSVISYKDVFKGKYLFYKHTRQEDTILFKHERAEI